MSKGRSLKRKFNVASRSLANARAAFERLDAAVPTDERTKWLNAERNAMERRLVDLKVMDMYEIQMDRGKSCQSMLWLDHQ